MTPKLIQETPHKIYELNSLRGKNWNQFVNWLNNLPDDDFSISTGDGYMFRFREKYDKDYFIMGFQYAWDLLEDAE